MGWVVSAILGSYMVVDLGTAHFGVEVDAPAGERQPAAVAEREVGPVMEIAEVAETTPAPPPNDATASEITLAPPPSADASAPAGDVAGVTEITAVAEDPPPRPRRRPLTATAFGEVVAPKRASLDRCARGLRDGPPVDAIVTVSADGRALGVQLSPRGVSHFAQTCASEVFTALHFPRTSADSTHTWPLHRPAGREE